MAERSRVLFVSEAVTLAQVVRLVVLARALDPRRFEVHFASARFDPLVFEGTSFTRWPIRSLPPERVARDVAAGRRLYDEATLERYVEEDRRLLASVRPALVVGDLRWSLAVSAPLAGVGHAALVNAYWSPHARRERFPMPDHPIVSLLGVEVAERYFPRALPHVFEHFARPLNRVRRRHRLPPIGSLPEVLTHGDLVLFPDVPELVPLRELPPHQTYLGPVSWEPDVPLPPWWRRLDSGRPTAYVTLGSSGRPELLPQVLDGLAAAGVQSMVSTAGRAGPATLPPHAHAAPYLPGAVAARRADFVVSNGGSSTGYQALAEGRPVLGIPSNLDQYLATEAIARTGAGVLVRAGTLTTQAVTQATRRLLDEPGAARAAARVAAAFRGWDACARFEALVAQAAAGARATA